MIRLERPSPGCVVAALADDAHHFALRLLHDAERVIRIEGRALRFPWTACPGAPERLQDLTGMAISPRCTAVGSQTKARENCTHLFDLAGLAVAFAAGGKARRTYLAAVRDRADGGEEATLERDGAPLLHWRYRDGRLESPEPCAGVALFSGGFLAWAEAHLHLAEDAEAAIVLRRATMIGRIRRAPFDPQARPADTQPIRGQCFAFQPGVAEHATRQPGTRHDFSTNCDALRRELEATLQEVTP
jgi:hypothetical protein